MKRFLSIGSLLLAIGLGSCQSHTSYDSSAGTDMSGTSTSGTGVSETGTSPTASPETSAQQEQMSPRVDAPNNVGMPADSSTNP